MKPHGARGEVSVTLAPGVAPESLGTLVLWAVPPSSRGAVPLRASSVRPAPKGPVVAFCDSSGSVPAGDLSGRWLLAHAEDAPGPVGLADEWLGAEVHDTTRGLLGTVTDVIITGANDVLVVGGEAFGQVLIPVIDDVILRVDVPAERIDVRLLPGLIDGDDA